MFQTISFIWQYFGNTWGSSLGTPEAVIWKHLRQLSGNTWGSTLETHEAVLWEHLRVQVCFTSDSRNYFFKLECLTLFHHNQSLPKHAVFLLFCGVCFLSVLSTLPPVWALCDTLHRFRFCQVQQVWQVWHVWHVRCIPQVLSSAASVARGRPGGLWEARLLRWGLSSY